MARQFDVQYLGGYMDGSAARKIEMPKPRKTVRKTAAKRNKRIVLHVDPLAILSIAVACVMMIMLTAGVFEFMDARQEMIQMDAYVQTLQQENAALQEEYDAGYDLENVKQTAQALGMVPVDQVKQVAIRVQVPEQVQPSGWEQFRMFLAGLFA